VLLQANAGVGKHAVMRPGFWRLSAAGSAMLLGCCSTLLVARALGTTLFGQYAFALWLATVAAPAAGAGMSALTSRVIVDIQSREKPHKAAGIFYFVLRQHYRKMALYCLFYLLLIIPFASFFGANVSLTLLLLAGLSAPPMLSGGITAITLRSLRRFDLLAATHLLGAAVTLLLVLLSAQSATPGMDQVYLFLLALAAASMFMLFVTILCIGKLLPLREAREPGPQLKQQLTRGLHNSLLLFTLDAIVWQHGELIVLGRGHSAAELGFYALSIIISARVMQLIPTLYATCVLPLWLRITPGRRSTDAASAYRRTTRGLVCLAIPVCALAIYFCPLLIGWCLGAAYLPIVTPLRILLFAAAVGSISSASITRMVPEEHKQARAWLGAAAATLNIALALPLIALVGISGAALASGIAQCFFALGSIILYAPVAQPRKMP
jgi:O-antigen/teichoic acid export membrane protein